MSVRRILLRWVVVLLGTIATVPALAQENPALHIYKLARALHADNIENQNFTYWVNGDVGEDLSIQVNLRPGDTMPDFTFQELTGKGSLSRTDLKPPYLLNFWASWCPPCRDEFPVLDEAVKSGELPMPVFFIDILDQQNEAIAFSSPYRARLKIYIDQINFAAQYTINAIPQTFLIDSNGKIQAIHLGNMTPAAVAFFAEIAAHPGIGAFDRLHPNEAPTPDYF